MSQGLLRLSLFCIWLGFWVVTTMILFTAPVFVNRGVVPILDPSDMVSAAVSVTTIWLPPVSCFIGFWFPAADRKDRRTAAVSTTRCFVAFAITGVYLAVVLLLVIWPIYFIRYTDRFAVLATGKSFLEQLDAHVKAALLASPIALAPITWLTRS